MTREFQISAALVCSIFLVSSSDKAAAQTATATKIHLTWVDSFDRIEPEPLNGIVLAKAMTLTLSDNKQVSEQHRASADQMQWGWKVGSTLGQGWRVVSPNVISRTDIFPNNITTWKVVVSGQTCTFTVSHSLKAGAKYFVTPMVSRPGRAGRYSRLEATQPRCSIE